MWVFQELSWDALALRGEVRAGATLSRGQQVINSSTLLPAEQVNLGWDSYYWTIGKPNMQASGATVSTYNVALTGTLREGAPFIIRRSPPIGNNLGGAYELITEKFAVRSSTITRYNFFQEMPTNPTGIVNPVRWDDYQIVKTEIKRNFP